MLFQICFVFVLFDAMIRNVLTSSAWPDVHVDSMCNWLLLNLLDRVVDVGAARCRQMPAQ